MKWIVSHQSALEYWRKVDAEEVLAKAKIRYIKPSAQPQNIKELQDVNFWDLSVPLHVLVGNDNARKAHRSLYCHISNRVFPKGSFVKMASGLIVSAPELCFLQMAESLSFIDLMVLGYELCGGYRLDSEGMNDQGFRGDLPLTNVSKLSSYISKAVGLKGRTNALRVLRFMADRSASPMETILTLLLTLPYRHGGYGLPKPLLNYRIDVPAKTGKPMGKDKYYCDLYWPDSQIDVEYDSDLYHTGSERIANDAIRRNALIGVGVTVITVSKIQIIEIMKLRDLAELLSKLLGKRLKYRTKEFTRCHAKLREQLLPRRLVNISANEVMRFK